MAWCPRFAGPPHRSHPISLKAVVETEIPNGLGFCIIARGSASELEYQLLLARDLKLIQLNDYEQLSQQTIEIKRMLTVLVQKLNAES
jgi:four helix bundle protein